MSHALDRPAWSALTSAHAGLAIGNAQALRYRPDVAMFAAAEEPTGDGLAAIAEPGEAIGTVELRPFALPGFMLRNAAAVLQLIAATDRGAPPAMDFVALGDADAPEMLALATLTRPGPYFANTHLFGDFVGVRIDGRLAAMAGARMQVPGFAEVSGVCTHPDFRGRGLARGLIAQVAARFRARGLVPFLHSYPDNDPALALYESLGFAVRQELRFAQWVRES